MEKMYIYDVKDGYPKDNILTFDIDLLEKCAENFNRAYGIETSIYDEIFKKEVYDKWCEEHIHLKDKYPNIFTLKWVKPIYSYSYDGDTIYLTEEDCAFLNVTKEYMDKVHTDNNDEWIFNEYEFIKYRALSLKNFFHTPENTPDEWKIQN